MAIAEKLFDLETSKYVVYREVKPSTNPHEPTHKLANICNSLLKPDWISSHTFFLMDTTNSQKATQLAVTFENPTRKERRQPTSFRLEDMQECLSTKAGGGQMRLLFDGQMWQMRSDQLNMDFQTAVSETQYLYSRGGVGFHKLRGSEVYQMSIIAFELTFTNATDEMEKLSEQMLALTLNLKELYTRGIELAPIAYRTTPLLPT